MCIYIYRERERDVYIYIYIYCCLCVHVCMYIYVYICLFDTIDRPSFPSTFMQCLRLPCTFPILYNILGRKVPGEILYT